MQRLTLRGLRTIFIDENGLSALLYDDKGMFNIGKRNYTVMRKMFWKNGIMITAEDVGGSKSRTARLRLADGIVTIRSQGKEFEL